MTSEMPITLIGLDHIARIRRARAARYLAMKKVRAMFRMFYRYFTRHTDLAKLRVMSPDDKKRSEQALSEWYRSAGIFNEQMLAMQNVHGAYLNAQTQAAQNVQGGGYGGLASHTVLPEAADDPAKFLDFREQVEQAFPLQQYESRPASRWRDLGEAGGVPADDYETAWKSYMEAMATHHSAASTLSETPQDTAIAVALAALTAPHTVSGETPAGFLRGWRDTLVAKQLADGEHLDHGYGNDRHKAMIAKLDWLLLRLAEAEDALSRR